MAVLVWVPCWVLGEEELEGGVNGHGVGAGRKGCVRKEARSCSVDKRVSVEDDDEQEPVLPMVAEDEVLPRDEDSSLPREAEDDGARWRSGLSDLRGRRVSVREDVLVLP